VLIVETTAAEVGIRAVSKVSRGEGGGVAVEAVVSGLVSGAALIGDWLAAAFG